MRDVMHELRKDTPKRMLVVFPHPDDETVMAGGLIQQAQSLGWKVKVITLTRGEAGKLYGKDGDENVIQIRGEEFEMAMKRLGVKDFGIWQYPDGKLRMGRGWQENLRKTMDEYKPRIVITYDHSGVTGHPDHIALSLGLRKIVNSYNQKSEDKVCLWWVAFSDSKVRDLLFNKAVEKYAAQPNLRLKLKRSFIWGKWRGIISYKSQRLDRGWPLLIMMLMIFHRVECFHEVEEKKRYDYKYVPFKI